MQLGSRWHVGSPPHPGVPELLHSAIAAAETDNTSGVAWTLTWLEGRPRVELSDATALVLVDLAVDPRGNVVARKPSSWPSAAHSGDSPTGAPPPDDNSDDDDDWLS